MLLASRPVLAAAALLPALTAFASLASLGCSSGDAGTTDDGGTASDGAAADATTPPGDGAHDAGTIPQGDAAPLPTGKDGGPILADPATCTQYCKDVFTACTDKNQIWQRDDGCRQACAYFPLGTAGDTSGDTIACRQTYTKLAASDPAKYCSPAGPYGGDVCGTRCHAFCLMATSHCGQFPPVPPYTSMDDCMHQCGTTFKYDPNMGEGTQATDSPTLNCREYHLGVAVVDPPNMPGGHCGHIRPDAGPCF